VLNCLSHVYHWSYALVAFKAEHIIGGWGVTPTGNSFRFVLSCARAVWLPSGIRAQLRGWSFPFVPFGPAEFSFFPCVAERLPFSPCEIEVRSKDNRSEFEVKSKWNRRESEVKSK
jgi:hypothetical protein